MVYSYLRPDSNSRLLSDSFLNMTVAELIAELQKMPQDATACFGGYDGSEITKVVFYSEDNSVEVY